MAVHESNKFPGHEARLLSHMMRIRGEMRERAEAEKQSVEAFGDET